MNLIAKIKAALSRETAKRSAIAWEKSQAFSALVFFAAVGCIVVVWYEVLTNGL